MALMMASYTMSTDDVYRDVPITLRRLAGGSLIGARKTLADRCRHTVQAVLEGRAALIEL